MSAPNRPKRPEVAQVAIVFSQEGDSCGPSDAVQELSVEAIDAGGGHYLVLKTERWAVDPDQLEDFLALLRRTLSVVEAE